MLKVYSLDTLGVSRQEQHDTVWIHKDHWLRLMHLDCPDVLLLRLVQGDVIRIATVGDNHEMNPGDIYVPYHMFGSFIEGEEVLVEREINMPPIVTKILLQPLDNELYHCDIAGAVGAVLGQWNVLSKHTTLSVPCEELGGYLVDVFIKDLEPADCCMLRGDVPLELAESLEQVEEFRPTSNSAPEHVSEPIHATASGFAVLDHLRVPTSNSAPEGMLQAPLPPAAVAEDTLMPNANANANAFVPFSGKGYSLKD